MLKIRGDKHLAVFGVLFYFRLVANREILVA